MAMSVDDVKLQNLLSHFSKDYKTESEEKIIFMIPIYKLIHLGFKIKEMVPL